MSDCTDPETERLLAHPSVQFWMQVAGETLAELSRRSAAEIARLERRIQALEAAAGIAKAPPPDDYLKRCAETLRRSGYDGERLQEVLRNYDRVRAQPKGAHADDA